MPEFSPYTWEMYNNFCHICTLYKNNQFQFKVFTLLSSNENLQKKKQIFDKIFGQYSKKLIVNNSFKNSKDEIY